jgi:regulator of protease activity HflC (stomatin/prohibitin superfamily)
MYPYPMHYEQPSAPARRRILVHELQHVVRIRNGRVAGVLEPGRHWVSKKTDRLWYESATDQVVTVPGQEMLTADGAGVRATVTATVAVTAPLTVVRNGGWNQAFYLGVQLALRTAVAERELAALLEQRGDLDRVLTDAVEPQAEPLGLTLRAIAVRDFIVPGELKRAVADIVSARLSGQAALERARGETAALRNLANAARQMADNPALFQLRLLQQIEASTGNTFVVGTDGLMSAGGDRD